MEKIINLLIETGAAKATKFISKKSIIRASRTIYKGKIVKGNVEIRLTIGKPNFSEREFIKVLKKSGEKFPVKNIILKFPKKK